MSSTGMHGFLISIFKLIGIESFYLMVHLRGKGNFTPFCIMVYETILSPPIPAFNNPPINPEYFQPSVFVIIAIATGITTLVTTSVAHNYVIGQSVRLNIPPTYGSTSLNQQTAQVLAIPASNQVILDIQSMYANPFKIGPGTTQAQIVAIGDVNSGFISLTGRVPYFTTIPGAFINVSPN